MRLSLLLSMMLITWVAAAQNKHERAIIDLLHQQDQCWNQGDIEGFMATYWKNDSLMFIGKSGVTYGWTNTLNNYKKGYPDTASMGKLDFKMIKIERISRKYYSVVGRWHLSRTKGDLQGHFTLLMKKIKRRWKIVADHSS